MRHGNTLTPIKGPKSKEEVKDVREPGSVIAKGRSQWGATSLGT